MSAPVLTIFLLTYNHAKYISKAFDSILAQETSYPYKVIVLDDASSDGTSDIARAYAQQYPDKVFTCIRETNLGVVENTFSALCQLDTEYFTILEGDDYWCDTTKIQQQLDLLKEHPDYDICGHDTLTHNFVTGSKGRMYHYTPDNAVILMQGINLPKVHPSSRIFRRKYDFSKIRPKEGVIFDSCTFWYYALKNPKLIFINKPMSVYNYTGEGIYSGASRLKQKLMALKSLAALNEALEFQHQSFIAKAFRKRLFKSDRLIFSVLYPLRKHLAYTWFIDKYAKAVHRAQKNQAA